MYVVEFVGIEYQRLASRLARSRLWCGVLLIVYWHQNLTNQLTNRCGGHQTVSQPVRAATQRRATLITTTVDIYTKVNR